MNDFHPVKRPRSSVLRRIASTMLTGVIIAICATPPAHGSAEDAALDELLARELARNHLPGMAVAVLRDDPVIKTAACGFADLELNVRATPDTVFQIQSITKTFTATAILLLAEEDKLSLDDPVGKFLGETPAAWEGITLRHLLNHTSGIKDFINDPTASLRLEVSEEEVLRATAARPLNFPPGERYAYSNSNYHLLALVIRKLTGQWYADFLRERIFVPLGMTRTRPVSLTEIIPGRASGYLWTGHSHRRGEFVAESILSYGGGGILSTAPDMALWARALLSGKVLKPESLTNAWTPAALKGGGNSSYGLGWGIGNVAGHREINHAGGHATGFSSFLALYPEDRLAVVVLLNGSGDAQRIARRVARIYLPALAPAIEKPMADTDPATTALLRECIEQTAAWQLPEDRFTPEMKRTLEKQKADIQAQRAGLGALRALELLARTEAAGVRTSRYRATFANGTVIMTLALDSKGRISKLEGADED